MLPKQDDFITLESVDYLVFFHGTEAEQETEEQKKERNKSKLHGLYNMVLSGNLDYVYTIRQQNLQEFSPTKLFHVEQ